MTIEHKWHVKWLEGYPDILFADISCEWDWRDIGTFQAEWQTMIQNHKRDCSLIISIPNDLRLPPDGFSKYSREAFDSQSKMNLNHICYIITNPHLELIWRATIDTYVEDTTRYRIVQSMHDAIQWITNGD